MRPIVQFFFSRLSGPGLRMWTQQSLGPTPLAAMTPGSTPNVGAVDAGLMPIAAVVLLVLIVWSAVKLYDRSRTREEEAAMTLVLREVDSIGKSCALQDRIAVTPARLGRAA